MNHDTFTYDDWVTEMREDDAADALGDKDEHERDCTCRYWVDAADALMDKYEHDDDDTFTYDDWVAEMRAEIAADALMDKYEHDDDYTCRALINNPALAILSRMVL